MDSTSTMEQQYPGVELAYPIAIASYETMFKRIDALENRVQSLMTFFVTVTLAVPAITAGKGLSYRSPFFIAAMILFVAANVFGLLARLRGCPRILNPKTLYKEYLVDNQWEFKKNAIYWAGESFEHNNGIVLRRTRYLNIMTFIFAVEVPALALWATSRF